MGSSEKERREGGCKMKMERRRRRRNEEEEEETLPLSFHNEQPSLLLLIGRSWMGEGGESCRRGVPPSIFPLPPPLF